MNFNIPKTLEIITALAYALSLFAASYGADPSQSLPNIQNSEQGYNSGKTVPAEVKFNEELSKEKAKLKKLKTYLQSILSKRATHSNPVDEIQSVITRIKRAKNIPSNDWLPPPRDRLSIKKGVGANQQMLYSIDATQVKLYDVIRGLAEARNAKLIIDSNIPEAQLSSLVSVYLKKVPFLDALGIILGMGGLEFTLNTSRSILTDNSQVELGEPPKREFDEIHITLPTSLDFNSPSEYFEKKAIGTYEKALVEEIDSPYVPKAYFELGNYYLRSGIPQIAVQEYQAILKYYPSSKFARLALYNSGKCFYELADYEKSQQTYFDFIDKYLGDPLIDEAYIAIAETYIAQKDYDRAIKMCKKVVDEYAESNSAPTAQYKLARIYFNTKRFGKALKEFIKLRSKYPKCEYTVEAAYEIANCLYFQRDFSQASLAFNAFLTRNPINNFSDKAYFRLADCFYELALPDKNDPGDSKIVASLEAYNGAIETFPNSDLVPYGIYRIGKCLQKLKLYEEAIKKLRDGILKYPESEYSNKMKMEIGRCYFEKEEFAQAYKIFEEVTKIVSVGTLAAEANMMAGNCLCAEKNYEEAIKFYKKVATIGTAPEKQEAYKKIGYCYQKLGKFEEAARIYLSVR